MPVKAQVAQIQVISSVPGQQKRYQTEYKDITLQIEIHSDEEPLAQSMIELTGLAGVFDEAIGFWFDQDSRDRLCEALESVAICNPINIRASQAIEDVIRMQMLEPAH